MNGRDYVLPEDVQTVFVGTVSHRLLLSADAQSSGLSENKILSDLMAQVPAPGV